MRQFKFSRRTEARLRVLTDILDANSETECLESLIYDYFNQFAAPEDQKLVEKLASAPLTPLTVPERLLRLREPLKHQRSRPRSSKYFGVTYARQKWQAYIVDPGTKAPRYLGRFETEYAAACAYTLEYWRLHPDQAPAEVAATLRAYIDAQAS